MSSFSISSNPIGGSSFFGSPTPSRTQSRNNFSIRVGSSASNASGPINYQNVEQIAKDLLALEKEGSASSTVLRNGSSRFSNRNVSAGSRAGGRARSTTEAISNIERQILNSKIPIEINEAEEIEVNGEKGIWANKSEVLQWRGAIPLEQYEINEDSNPEIINKRSDQKLEYIQELAIRYLRPPTPPPAGEIVITQEANISTPPAPALILRQQPARPDTPEPLVIREAPPPPPGQVGKKVITISGKKLPPPPRKVVIERLAPLPSKPQSVIVERWLPYAQTKRRVIFNKSNEADAVVIKPRNVIIQWEAPEVDIKKEFKYLGVVKANPFEYVERYGSSLKVPSELPDYVLEIKTPDDIVLAADFKSKTAHQLEGDVQALKLVDLDKEGLAEYRELLQGSSSSFGASASAARSSSAFVNSSSAASGSASASSNIDSLVEKVFYSLAKNGSDKITIEDAEKALLKVNSRFGRKYGEDDVKSFFRVLDSNRNGFIELNEFKKIFLNLSI